MASERPDWRPFRNVTQPRPKTILFGQAGFIILCGGGRGEPHARLPKTHVWDLLEAKSNKELRRIIRWSTNGVIALFPEVDPGEEESGDVIADGMRNIDWLKRWKPGDVIGPAKLYLVDQFNEKMHQMASPMLLLDAKGALRPYNSPASLLGALWLEFGQVASGVRKQIPCESCGQWMDVTNNRSTNVNTLTVRSEKRWRDTDIAKGLKVVKRERGDGKIVFARGREQQ